MQEARPVKGLAFFCILFLLAFPREAQVGQVHFDTISLSRMIEMSPVIVLVRRCAVAPVTKKIQPPSCKDPYVYIETRYGVIEILRGPEHLGLNNEITVTGFNPAMLKLHIDYHVRGLSRSPIFPSYEQEKPRRPVGDNGSILFLKPIVFLLRDPDGKLATEVNAFAPVCWNAEESPARKKEILSMLKAEPAADYLDITIGTYRDLLNEEETELIKPIKSLFPGFKSYSWKTLNINPAP